jgi:hypothetical protein
MEPWEKEFGDNITKIIDQTIFRGCACIMHSQDMKVHDYRSGIFVQVAESHFLVTAAMGNG